MVSLTKSTVRPAANVATAGIAAPVLSTVEDVTSIGLVFVAILLPILVLVALFPLIWGAYRLWRWRRRRNEAKVGIYARSSAAPRPSAVDPWE